MCNAKVKLVSCDSGKCCDDLETNNCAARIIPHPPNVQRQKTVLDEKQLENNATTDTSPDTSAKNKKKKNSPGQRKRKKAQRRQERDQQERTTPQSKQPSISSTPKNVLEIDNSPAIAKPFFVKVKQSCLQQIALHKSFGNCFTSSNTFPWRFMLDLSPRIHDFLSDYINFLKEPFAEPSLVLLFEAIDGETENKAFNFIWLVFCFFTL